MSRGNPSDEGIRASGPPETQWHGEKPATSETVAPIHEEATILGGLDVQRPGTSSADDRATGVADLADFRRALIEIGLFNETELEPLAAAVPESEGVLGLARVLQQAGRLTRYQAAALYQRKSRGLLIGNYLILDKLGQGGMGMVFKARHRRLGLLVALKILPPSFARDKTAVDRFKREVEAVGRLKHANIVTALDADEDRGVHFLVMEYVEGSDLDHVVRHRGQLPLGQAIDFVIQSARGLEAAHAQRIVHRDIKPSNLILDGAGTVRVLDLGLALIVDASNPYGQAAGARLTQSGTYMGTVDYMAPEQAEDSRKADHRADIYSLGCTFYFLLTGREPFVGETILKRLMAHIERPAPTLRAVRPDVPTGIEDVYQKMMAKRPSDRPESMTEIIRLLEMCKEAAEASPPQEKAPKSSPRLMVFNEGGPRKAGTPPRAGRDEPVFSERDDEVGVQIGSGLNLEDLAMDVRSEVALPPLSAPTIKRAVKARTGETEHPATARPATPRRTRRPAIMAGMAAIALVGAVAARLALFSGRSESPTDSAPSVAGSGGLQIGPQSDVSPPPPKPEWVSRTIFDGKSPDGWMLTNHRPLPRQHVQVDGLNPHGTGSYMVVYGQKLGDFILGFDYKLSADCNSGVFLRVGDLNDVPNSGIEVELVDKPTRAIRESGAFCDLVPAASHAQKPGGQWNHMKITAQGPVIAVTLNGTEVSWINLDVWTQPGKRPDGSDHKFKQVAFARLHRSGYIGFQDLQGDCWFKDIVLKTPAAGSIATPVP